MNNVLKTNLAQRQSQLKAYNVLAITSTWLWNLDTETIRYKNIKDSRDEIDETHSRIQFIRQ